MLKSLECNSHFPPGVVVGGGSKFCIDFLDPMKQATERFQLSDIAFNRFKEEMQGTSIVFKTVGTPKRIKIAE